MSGEPAVIAYAENMLGTSTQDEGSLREAVRHYTEAVRLYTEIGDAYGEAAANNNLGACLQDLGMLDAARHHYEVAQKADERAGDYVDMAVAYNNIGETQVMQGDIAGAQASLQRVLDAHQAEEELTAVAGISHINLCKCAIANGNLEEAESHVREGIRLLRRVGAKGLLIEAHMQLAELYVARGTCSCSPYRGRRPQGRAKLRRQAHGGARRTHRRHRARSRRKRRRRGGTFVRKHHARPAYRCRL